ncbi:MAG: hypothetical protein C4562_04130 [Actinobacteria bacterium]|nr:MAG: hypothetical protein C4562_04130 [Actinomycetota bacterium]
MKAINTITELIVLPYADRDKQTLLDVLVDEFSNKNWSSFYGAVAFAKESGNFPILIDAIQKFAESGSKVSITFGADVFGGKAKGSDYEALKYILEKFNDYGNIQFHLYHESGRTFHPKIFLYANEEEKKALLIVGSSNWSQGGLLDNVEANVLIHLNLEEGSHLNLFNEMLSYFNSFWMEQK